MTSRIPTGWIMPDPRKAARRRALHQKRVARMNHVLDTVVDVAAGLVPIGLFVLATYLLGALTLSWNVGHWPF